MPAAAFFLKNGLDGRGTMMKRNLVVFGFGLVLALLVGWVAFPRALYVTRSQPFEFRHKTHAEKSGITDCSNCHALRDDGSFVGVASTESCAGCHADRLGTSVAEATLVDSYVKTGRETPWLIYSRQPSNVWFSHAVHLRRAGLTARTAMEITASPTPCVGIN